MLVPASARLSESSALSSLAPRSLELPLSPFAADHH